MRSEEVGTMIGRRPLLVAAAGLPLAEFARPAAAALPVPRANALQFKVLRGDSEIGKHVLTFERAGNRLSVHVAVDLAVSIGPVTVFRYTHRGLETWEDERYVAFESTTNHDGKPHFCKVARGADGALQVESDLGGKYTAPENALTTTYWNKAVLSVPMINSEDGRLMHEPVKDLGAQPVKLASGVEVQANRYNQSGVVPLDIWYDAAPSWVHLVFYRNGDTSSTPIIYVRV
jgi:hypothetical protein